MQLRRLQQSILELLQPQTAHQRIPLENQAARVYSVRQVLHSILATQGAYPCAHWGEATAVTDMRKAISACFADLFSQENT